MRESITMDIIVILTSLTPQLATKCWEMDFFLELPEHKDYDWLSDVTETIMFFLWNWIPSNNKNVANVSLLWTA